MKKQKITLLMDEKRNLYIKDSKGVEYAFWVLGWGVPASFIIRTEAEQLEEDRKYKEREKKEIYENEIYEREKKPWYKRIF